MLKNFWYGLEHSAAVTSQPRAVMLMDQEIVLYRDSRGQVIALNNHCAHRGTALSGGWVEADCLHCPYHGWQYQADGTCTQIPANQPGVAIPLRAKVDRYPTQEAYGLVWIFWGDLPVAERPPILELPEYHDPTWRVVTGDFTWNGHYTRVVANTVDMSHAPFVHASAFGRKDKPRIQNYTIARSEWGGSGSISFKTKPAHFLKFILGNSPPDGSITTSFHMPNITQVYHQFGDIKFILYLAHVPISERLTITKWLHLRNFVVHPLADYFMRRDILKTFEQDNSVVALQPVGPAPLNLSEELHVPSDGVEVAFRKMRIQYMGQNCESVLPHRGG